MGGTVESYHQLGATEGKPPYSARGEGTGGRTRGQDHLKTSGIRKAFPKSKKDSLPGSGHGKFHVQDTAGGQFAVEVVAAVALIAGGTDNDGPPLLSHSVHIGLKEGLPLVGTLVGAVAEIDNAGHARQSGTVQDKFDPTHDVGAGRAVAASHFDCHNGGLRRDAAAACCNGRCGGAVSHDIPAEDHPLINFGRRIDGTLAEAQGGISGDGHIPEPEDSGPSLLRKKFRVSQINAGIDEADYDPVAGEAQGFVSLHGCDAGAVQAGEQ